MKKIILTAVVIFTVNILIAQNHTEFGIKGGVNIASLNFENNSDFSSRTSFHLGGLAHIHLSKQFAFQPELMYSGQGADHAVGNIKLSYINVPLLGQYMFGPGFRLETGPQLGFLAGAKVGDSEANDDFKTFDLSWAFGVGYITTSGFGLDARYNLGLTDTRENNTNVKNSVWQLGVFYQFRQK